MKTPAILQAFQNDILPAGAQLLQADDPVEIGGHRLAGRLLSSGAGVAYLAHDRRAGLVTVKTTDAETGDADPVRARLRTEAACARRLPSSCTARLIHDGTDQTPPFLVSEHLRGISLERVIDLKGPLPPAMVAGLAAELAQALAAVHETGVVHGNLTPANVLLTKAGLRVVDFGVAQEISTSHAPAEAGAAADNPAWLAPELLTGRPPGPACDMYGWGCVIAYAATGHSPPDATPLDVPTGPLRRLVEAAVSADPADRPTAAVLTCRLAAPVTGDPDTGDPEPAAHAEPHVVVPTRRPRLVRSRAVLSTLLTLATLLVAISTVTEHRAPDPAPPPVPGPPASPRRTPGHTSNAAARSLYDPPPAATPSRGRSVRRPPSARPPHGVVWMSCSSDRAGRCTTGIASGGTGSGSSGWRLTWTIP